MEQPANEERREIRRQEKLQKQEAAVRKHRFKKIALWSVGGILVIAVIGSLIWYGVARLAIPKSDIVSRNGLHWHPELSIKILGQKQIIPVNIGLGIIERPIHTHDDMGVIHLEFSGIVKKSDVQLSQFFKIWGKKFNKDCIFDKCSGPEGTLKMLVNGKENNEFENYIMEDGDKIEIIFE